QNTNIMLQYCKNKCKTLFQIASRLSTSSSTYPAKIVLINRKFAVKNISYQKLSFQKTNF
ncbi:MAG: hypothetical protein Q8874_02720, partial [Sweet potato little leaf phytoplasma]|nr:hypothetical protein [Sweet potato little leaf phytoplasma]